MIDTIDFLKLLTNQHRLDIIHIMRDEHVPDIWMSSVRAVVGISKAAFSQHIAKMRDADIIKITPAGRYSYMRLTLTEHQEQIVAAIFEDDA